MDVSEREESLKRDLPAAGDLPVSDRFELPRGPRVIFPVSRWEGGLGFRV